LIQSGIGDVVAGSLFALLQSLGTAPIFTGIVAGLITGTIGLIAFISAHGFDAVLQSFIQLVQPIISAIGDIIHRIPALLEQIPNIINSVILFIPGLAKVVISKVLEFISMIPGGLKDALVAIPAAIKAIIDSLIGHIIGAK
jgi:phage-related protein